MFDPNKEKLLCMQTLDDDLAAELGLPTNAFWRGFIVQDRESKRISGRYRFKYDQGEPHWYELKRSLDNPSFTVEELVKGVGMAVTVMAKIAAQAMNVDISDREIFECHYPPDDNGDVNATLSWLLQQDLVEVTAIGTGPELTKDGHIQRADMIVKVELPKVKDD